MSTDGTTTSEYYFSAYEGSDAGGYVTADEDRCSTVDGSVCGSGAARLESLYFTRATETPVSYALPSNLNFSIFGGGGGLTPKMANISEDQSSTTSRTREVSFRNEDVTEKRIGKDGDDEDDDNAECVVKERPINSQYGKQPFEDVVGRKGSAMLAILTLVLIIAILWGALKGVSDAFRKKNNKLHLRGANTTATALTDTNHHMSIDTIGDY